MPPEVGEVVEVVEADGLYQHNRRRAACAARSVGRTLALAASDGSGVSALKETAAR